MKRLLLLLVLPLQEPPDLEPLFNRMTSLDPSARVLARAEFEKLGKEALKESPLALAFRGDASSKKEIGKLLASVKPEIVRWAAEAAGTVDPDGTAKELSRLLESDDLATALAAARSLSRAKAARIRAALAALADRPENPRRKVVACYGVELSDPGPHLPALFAQAESGVASVRQAAWAVLANLPHAAAALRKRPDPKGREVAPEMKRLFESHPLAPELRELFGRFLLNAGAYEYADLVAMTTARSEDVAAWAKKMTVDPALLRKSALVAVVLSKLSEVKDEKDAAKEPAATLLGLLEAEGLKTTGATVQERMDSVKAEWERNRIAILDRDVNRAIEEGVLWLKSTQLENGSWKFCTCGASAGGDGFAPGTTALALYTLLKCDVPLREKSVQSGFDWLLKEPLPNHTYTVSLEAMACGEAIELLWPSWRAEKNKVLKAELTLAIERYGKRLREAETWLVDAQTRANRGGIESGDWGYEKPASRDMDNSNTQFAILGLRAAQNAGVPAPDLAWAKALNHWLFDQTKDGGWPYRHSPTDPNQGGTRSMSAAGMYSTLVAKASLRRKDPSTLVGDEPIRKVMALFARQYPIPEARQDRPQGHVGSPYYDLYSLERAMMVSKTEKLGGRDWYRDGALYILVNQEAAGEWIDTTDTCFALLFLKKAYVAVATGESR